MTRTKLHFYCDASSHRNHKYMVAGGVAVSEPRSVEVEAAVKELKGRHGISKRFHWSDYRGGPRKDAYFELVDLFFSLVSSRRIHAQFIICDFHAFDHRIRGNGKRESSVNRMYYLLFLYRLCRFYGSDCALYAFPDRGGDSAEVIGFRDAICAAAYNTFKTRPNCLRLIRPTSSHESHILQMVDVIIGAAAAHREGRNLAPHKAELMDHIIGKAGIDWASDTPLSERHFNVWNFRGRS